MHKKLGARGKSWRTVFLLLTSEHNKLRPSVEPMTINAIG